MQRREDTTTTATRTPDPAGPVMEPRLERAGRRLGHSAAWFLLIALIPLVPGIVLLVIGTTWSIAFGVLGVVLACLPGSVGVGLLGSSLVSRWAARHRSFA